MPADVVSMALGSVPVGEQRSRFLAVGLADSTVRIISLDPSVSNQVLLILAYLCKMLLIRRTVLDHNVLYL